MEEVRKQNMRMDDQWIRELAESDVRLNIRLTNDFAFKRTFHNEKALKGLISALLDIDVKEIERIEFDDTFLRGEYPKEHEGILDIRIHLNEKRRINVEIQVEFFPYWRERSLFYLSKMYIDGFYKGAKYSELEECIHIGILKFDLWENPPLYSKIELWDVDSKRKYSDKMSLRVLELSQLEKASEEERKTDIYLWAKMISAEDWEVLNMLAKENEYLQAAKEEMEKINSDQAMRYAYLMEEMKASDEATLRGYYEDEIAKSQEDGIRQGIKQGITQGIAQGITQGITQGEERFGQLCMKLLADKRQEELERASSDREYRQILYKEYNL